MAFSIPNLSHSGGLFIPIPIPEMYALWDLFPFPYYSRKLIHVPSHSHSRQRPNHESNISNHSMCVGPFVFIDYKSQKHHCCKTNCIEVYGYQWLYRKHNRLHLNSPTFSEQPLLAQASNTSLRAVAAMTTRCRCKFR